jgi:ferredoxin-NADP reductase
MSHPYIELRIIAIRKETFDTKSFVLQPVNTVHLSYKPGQFLTLVFPGRYEERRSYSISSMPPLELLTITVKRIDNGEFSRYLFDTCQEGSVLYTIGASGFFTIPEDVDKHKFFFFFAAGSGITPILPLIKTILIHHSHLNVYLIYSNHSPESTIFLQELQDLEARYPEHLRIEWLFSIARNLLRARLSKSLVEEFLNFIPRSDRSKELFYLCGPHFYMQMISITLLREGVSPENIRKEIFNTTKPLVKELPPDQNPHQVTVFYSGETYKFEAGFPTTILAAAKQKGIALPYSCEAGKCGTCAATCIQGIVWMSYNEVLLDKELTSGRVLTCTGFPVGGDVTLEFPKLLE